MRKDELEDRLMDALLRGECEENLAEGLLPVKASSHPGLRWGAAGLAASLLLGGVYLFSRMPGTRGDGVAATPSEPRPEVLVDLEASYRTREAETAAVLPADWKPGTLENRARPSAPDSALAKVIASNTGSPTSIPVPEMGPVASTDFDDGDGFGAGWGVSGAGGGGSFFGTAFSGTALFGRAEPLLQERVTDSAREGSREQYGQLVDQPWKSPLQEALSTFSVDVDTASYPNIRRMMSGGIAVPKDSVRIEELVNYFRYHYPQPPEGQPFGVGLMMTSCPWEPKHQLVRVALQGKEVTAEERGEANLVFLVDVSGSMNDSDKLPLLVESLQLLVEELRENDRVALVVYAGSEGVVLEPTKMGQGGRETVTAALGRLAAGGSTNGGAGIQQAYQLARENFVEGGINRVILATDGDFNVGPTRREDLVSLVKKEAEGGVFLSVCGFGGGNLNDAMLEAITNEGNGVYYYIDSREEGRRVFVEGLMGTLVTIAKDVKLQVEFNPEKVSQYRLIGYANRILRKEDFNNDQVDAGDIGSGHQVTAFYEIVPTGGAGTLRPAVDELKYAPKVALPKEETLSQEWLTVKLRHKQPDGEVSELREFVLKGGALPWTEADADFQFAAGVALWGMTLRQSATELPLALLLAERGASEKEEREDFLRMSKKQLALLEGSWLLVNASGQPLRIACGDLRAELASGEEVLTHWTERMGRGDDDKAMPLSLYQKTGKEWRKIYQNQLTMAQLSGRALVLVPGDEFVKVESIELR